MSWVTANVYFLSAHGISDQYNAEQIAPKRISGIPRKPPSTPAATKINGNHQSMWPVKKIVLTGVKRAINRCRIIPINIAMPISPPKEAVKVASFRPSATVPFSD